MRKWMMAVVVLSVLLPDARAYTHEPMGSIGVKRATRAKQLSSLCMDGDGNIVTADEAGKCLRVIAPDDTLKVRWKLKFAPQAVSWRASDKTVLVAGSGKVAVLDAAGKVVCSASLPQTVSPEDNMKMSAAEREEFLESSKEASSVTSSGDDVFVTAQSYTGYTVYRLDRKLEHAKAIITGLQGCCGQMDVMASGDTLYVAANCDFEVSLYDRDGKKKGAVTKPEGAKYFDGCCEPKNVSMGADGSLYVAESAQGAVNRFSKDGKHLGEVGMVKDIGGCVRVTIAVSPDGSRVYMLDTEQNIVRVLGKKN